MTMIASVLHLDRAAVQALKITDPYSLHRVVYSLYEDIRDENQKVSSESSGILYADMGGDSRGRKVILLANREPKSAVDNRHGEVLSKEIPKGFLQHQTYQFSVNVNPVKRNNRTRKIEAVRGREAIANWFAERSAQNWGFRVDAPSLQIANVQVLQFQDKKQRNVTLGQAKVTGALRVTCQETFEKSFTSGIGKARAFGFGLLQLVPCPEHSFS